MSKSIAESIGSPNVSFTQAKGFPLGMAKMVLSGEGATVVQEMEDDARTLP